MSLLPLDKLGARETAPQTLSFGIFLPGLTAAKKYQVAVKIIHEDEQFLQAIAPTPFPLAYSQDASFPLYGDYWSCDIDLTTQPAVNRSPQWGKPGRYVYRFVVTKPDGTEIDWVIDPFAREYGVGDLSAVTLGYQPYVWSTSEASWQTPALRDMVWYELMISEFGADIDGTIQMLDYLADLGINGIEVMPVNNVKNTINWGYDPIGYFGVDERFGKRADFQRLVDEAHRRGIAVILDVVYGHTADDFAYPYLYQQLSEASPFNGSPVRFNFGPACDFSQPFTQDFFQTANAHWLETYHLDGFRYDNVNGYWDGTPTDKYALLTQATYQRVQTGLAAGGAANPWQRFQPAAGESGLRLIQCAEYLDNPPAVLSQTYTNCTWQDRTLNAAHDVAVATPSALVNLGLQWGLVGYPGFATVGGDTLDRTALQYLENHDHLRFLCNFGLLPSDDSLLAEGDRSQWYRMQPYLLGLLLAKGVPMLWEGEELAENYFVPPGGYGRTGLFRPVHWSYFYDAEGKSLVNQVRKWIKLRRNSPQFRSGDHQFYNDYDAYLQHGLLLFSRSLGTIFSLVALNFTGQTQTASFAFPRPGHYVEELDGVQNLDTAATPTAFSVPSNYGQVWTITT